MNIDNSSLLSLLSPTMTSVDENLQSLQQTLQLDFDGAQEFTNTLLDTIKQINDLQNKEKGTGNVMTTFPENTNKLYQIAGLMNGNEVGTVFSGIFGKELPVVTGLEKDIDLENTMVALASVMNTLEDVVLKDVDIEKKLDILVEKMAVINAIVPEQDKLTRRVLTEKIDKITIELDNIKGVVLKNNDLYLKSKSVNDKEMGVSEIIVSETKINDAIHEEKRAVPNQLKIAGNEDGHKSQIEKKLKPVTQVKSIELVSNTEYSVKEESSSVAVNLVNRLEKVVEVVKQIKVDTVKEKTLDEDVGLGTEADKVLVEIEIVIAEIETIKIAIAEKNTMQQVAKIADHVENDNQEYKEKNQVIIGHRQLDIAGKENDSLTLEKQIAEIVATLDKPLDKEKTTIHRTFFDVKPDIKKEALPFKQVSTTLTLDIKSKTESEMLFQQENKLNILEQESPVVKAKQIEKSELLDGKEFETKLDKSSAKFTIDVTNLNRSIRLENKTDITPMSKHFSHPEWNKEISERVIWMHKQEIPSAELRLNPRHLGPITIKIDVTQDQATVAFTAQHAAVKEAIEAALPKLREMFSNQQLNLAEVNVSQEDAGHRQSRQFNQMGSNSNSKNDKEKSDLVDIERAENSLEIVDEIEAGRAIASNGILSIFA